MPAYYALSIKVLGLAVLLLNCPLALSFDSDGDGIPNNVESAAGLDRFDAADGLLDKDGDGFNNLLEFHHGTGINNASSNLNSADNYHYKAFAPDIGRLDAFARAVAIDGDTAILGSSGADGTSGSNVGAAYIFVRSGDDWLLQQKLQPDVELTNGRAGWSVAISGDTVAFGALGSTESVYVFTRTGTTWTQQARIVPGTPLSDIDYGYRIALEGDTLVVAAINHVAFGTPGDLRAGRVYVYTRAADIWSEEAVLATSDSFPNQRFGWDVDISGDTIVAGALRGVDDPNSNSAAYIFTRTAGVWSEQTKLTPADIPPLQSNGFGQHVSISGDTVAIGASSDSEADFGTGAVYIFTRSAGVWTQQHKLMPCDAPRSAAFGSSLSLLNNTLLVGASYLTGQYPFPHPLALQVRNVGGAYAYEYDGSQWINTAKLVPNDVPFNLDPDPIGYGLGFQVATGSTYAVLSASSHNDMGDYAGMAYFFDYSKKVTACIPPSTLDTDGDGLLDGKDADIDGDGIPNVVEQLAGLDEFDATDANEDLDQDLWPNIVEYRIGTALDDAGDTPLNVSHPYQKVFMPDAEYEDGCCSRVVMSGTTAVLSAPGHNAFQTGKHPVYVFEFNGSIWEQQAKLVGNESIPGDGFGDALALRGDTLVVGAYNTRVGNDGSVGAAYVFTRSAGSWSQQAMLMANDAEAYDNFGGAIAVDGDTIAIGSHRDDHSFTQAGAVYIYTRTGGLWSGQAKLVASDAEASAHFGSAVALENDHLIVGAERDDSSGSVYFFEWNGAAWTEQQKIHDGIRAFGHSVALSGDTAVVGNSAGKPVHVYVYNGASWVEQAELLPDVPINLDRFGDQLVIEGDRLLIGAASTTNAGDATGAAYLFTRSGSSWTQQAIFTANTQDAYDQFGYVALSGDVALFGAPGDDDTPYNAGAGYFLDLDLDDDGLLNPVDDDDDGDGLLDSFEVSYSLDPFHVGDEEYDNDGDGLANLQEQALGTDPQDSDSDGDGYDDGYEVNHGADPLDPDDFPAFNVPGLPPLAPWLLLIAMAVASRFARPSSA